MPKHSQKGSHRSSFYRLIAASLGVAGVSSLLLPYLAIAQTVPPTPANTLIQNRASGTYEDPNNPGVPITTTSNTVDVTVAEVAGITNTPAGIIDTNGGSISTNDVINFDFLVTNTGNAPSHIFFPSIAAITAVADAVNGLDEAGLQYQLDLNNDGDFDDANETLRSTAFDTATITPTTPIASGASVRVRVVGTVTATGAGDAVNVRYGDTGANDNSAGTQNQPDTGTEPPAAAGGDTPTGANEVRTVNFDDPAVAGTDLPVNGVREASAFQGGTVATAIRNIALSTVLKARVAYDPVTPATVTDDLLTYRLDLRVADLSPNPSIYTTTALEGTTIRLIDGGPEADATRILISDVIPTGTVIDHTFDAALNLPANWQAVYQYGAATLPTTTVPVVSTAAGALPAAVWSTTAPTAGTAATVRRVGYIFTGTLPTGFRTDLVTNAFRIRVRTSGLPAEGGVINNIAQVFGETVGDATNRVVYDESGDQNPNNFEGAVPPAVEGTLFNPTTDTGLANPGVQDTDGANNNSGSGPAGEVNIFPIVPPGSILNGPNNVPGAIGINNNQDDFTNRSAALPAANSVPGTTYDPDPIVFNNTFQNPPSNTTRLDTVRLLPLPPDNASIPTTVVGSTQPAADIPDGTRVTITFGTQVAAYDYAGGVYTFVPAASSGLPPGSQSILLDNVLPGVLNNYTVSLNLPGGTALSADRFANSGNDPTRAGFNVPIVAFVDNDNNGAFLAANDPIFNITIDRGYTGYVRLRKRSQVLQGTNPRPVTPASNGSLDTTPKTAEPGNVIRYVIDYVNFSLPLTAASTGSVILDAANLVITENGALAPNNWGAVSVHFSNATVEGGFAQTTFATQGSITYDGAAIPDPLTGATVGIYVNNVGTISPAADPAIFQGQFRFHRRVN
ncbi:hypothetical protein H6F44_09590 [Pseudanabaena sp. FACHB-1277]|uniref:DUF7925 domain-containing protein n=1 Tax=Pseudanabaena cinerea FACHB-1277 TaxID=2949581 RepID=A0A926UT71_9CYAN|nr:hypothetical protein [Pseudanabaena cinerea]MBD2150368.1 hypothetical protein [Pseudanabaena cinerea FACHB-1277]